MRKNYKRIKKENRRGKGHVGFVHVTDLIQKHWTFLLFPIIIMNNSA